MKIRMRQMVVGAALVGAAAAGSALAASALTPNATNDTPTTQTTDTTAAAQTSDTAVGNPDGGATDPAGADSRATPPADQQGNFDPTKGGHQFNGVTEKLLEGDTATKVKAAAESAVSGGTVERVENDAEGNAPFEAHVVKSDGSHVTVYVNADYSVKGVEADHGGPHGPRGPHGPQGQPPVAGQSSGTDSTGQGA